MLSFQPIDAALYFELYLALSVLLLLKTKIRLSSSAFIFFAFYTLQMGLGPIIEISFNRGMPSLVNPFIDVLWPFGMFVAGYYFASLFRGVRRMSRGGSLPVVIRTETLWWAYVVCLFAGIVYILKTGLNPFSDSFNDDRIANQSGMGVFTYLNGALIVILPLLFERALENRLSKKAFVFSLVCAMAVFLLRGSRGLCMTPLFLMGMLIDLRKPIDWKTIICLGFLCLGIVSVMGAMRSGNGSSILDSFVNTTCNHIENLNRVYGAFKSSSNFQYGSTFFFNYNIVLPGEGQDYTMWLKELVGATFSGGGMTPSIIGDFYINFGYFGVYAGMFLLGFTAYKLERIARDSSLNKVFLVYLCWECATVVGGGISNGVLVLTTNSLMYLGLKFITNRKKPVHCVRNISDGLVSEHHDLTWSFKNQRALFYR